MWIAGAKLAVLSLAKSLFGGGAHTFSSFRRTYLILPNSDPQVSLQIIYQTTRGTLYSFAPATIDPGEHLGTLQIVLASLSVALLISCPSLLADDLKI